ncbi:MULTISPECIES: hypothetical protein [Streptomyces]|uniref:Secreted protein n=1 Tax=Streptomyces cadmiisoli TaxID=2184053 RepID=A0A2Z4J7P3_9ACTN|nr:MULTISPECIES: hypothetical protein [Streptomyces]AWW41099.1 hypothetical protein DN051_34165 [Streptomyces cadmiisoli]KOV53890.1 hypothetical protein ADL00_32475 [Streptomyces sp. AS58]
MTTSQPFLRAGLTLAAAALPITLAAGPAGAAGGISVNTSGSTVSVTTTACAQLNGSWGVASLLTSNQTSFAQGRQVTLSASGGLQTAAWSNVTPGTYTVVVVCSNNNTAGTQSVIVSAPSKSTISATSTPSRGVLGGVGGTNKDYSTVTMVAGGALVGTGVIAAAWFLRRRSKPYRL